MYINNLVLFVLNMDKRIKSNTTKVYKSESLIQYLLNLHESVQPQKDHLPILNITLLLSQELYSLI